VTCQQVDELAAAFVLGAVTPEQREEIEEHLATCNEHSTVLVEMRATAGVLNQAPEEREPSPDLKARIMSAARADVAPRRAESVRPVRRSSRGWFGWLPHIPLGVAVGALSVAVAALLVWNVALQFSRPQEADAFVRYMGQEDTHAFLYFVEDVGVITATGMDPLPANKTYQAWGVIDGEPVSLGVLDVQEDGEGFVLLSRHVTKKEPVFITIESAGGADHPSASRVLWTNDK
jgi:anti-sigma-K factor RskA